MRKDGSTARVLTSACPVLQDAGQTGGISLPACVGVSNGEGTFRFFYNPLSVALSILLHQYYFPYMFFFLNKVADLINLPSL